MKNSKNNIKSSKSFAKEYFRELEKVRKEIDFIKINFVTDLLQDLYKNNKTLYVAESLTEKKIVPNFLINKNDIVNDINILLEGLKLVGDFMDKNILKPNNLNFPISRNQFVNSLKQLN